MAIISELVVYPVKSLQGISVSSAELTEQGLKWDRFWMIVNQDGQFASQRHFSQMATVATELTDSHLILSHAEHQDLLIPLQSNDEVKRNRCVVKVWSSECEALNEGQLASDWLTNVLGQWRGQNLSLVRMAHDFQRAVSNKHTQGTENTTYFSDGYPYLVTTTASLEVLNQKLEQQSENAIPMDRFRANIVVDNKEDIANAFIENRSDFLEIGPNEYLLELCKPCERCKVPSIDQKSGFSESPQQPLKTLFAMDHVQQKGAYFGHNAVLSESAKVKANTEQKTLLVSVGDSVEFV
ncbi:MAG: MOSC N-terminal beta barrel domain-containing protein [Gammaproteobacteria bacterium]|nr:MOSC N-terminal beta barrel domain-containing protein [Gammaproteobacteria bacterium]